MGRSRGPRLTRELGEFDELWASAAVAVRRAVTARGLRGGDVDDAVQEVGLRALHALRSGVIETSFTGWCVGAAKHVAADHWRLAARTEYGEIDDRRSAECVEAAVQARLDLVGLQRAWGVLSEVDRAVLISGAPDAMATVAERDRFYVALHRARRKARKLAESFAPGLFAWIERARATMQLGGIEAFVPLAAAAGYTAMALFLPAAPTYVDPPESPRRMEAVVATQLAGAAGVDFAPRRAPSTATDVRRRHDERGAEPMRAPVERRSEVYLPDGTRTYGELYEGERGAPAFCVTAPPVAPQLCVDYPGSDVSDRNL